MVWLGRWLMTRVRGRRLARLSRWHWTGLGRWLLDRHGRWFLARL